MKRRNIYKRNVVHYSSFCDRNMWDDDNGMRWIETTHAVVVLNWLRCQITRTDASTALIVEITGWVISISQSTICFSNRTKNVLSDPLFSFFLLLAIIWRCPDFPLFIPSFLFVHFFPSSVEKEYSEILLQTLEISPNMTPYKKKKVSSIVS